MRLPLVLCAVSLLLFAACGGSDDDDENGVDVPTTAPESNGGNGDEEDPTTAPEANGDGDEGDGDSSAGDLEENTAVVTLAGETYNYVLSESGACDADFVGTFRAFLRRVDSGGAFVQTSDGLFEGLTLSLNEATYSGHESGILALLMEPEWMADPTIVEGSGIDNYTIDGNVATGSATFGTPDGETAEGTFAVRCEG